MRQSLTGQFTGAGAGASMSFTGTYNVTISGTFVAAVALQRSFDQGVTWHTMANDVYGTPASFTGPITFIAFEAEDGVLHRLNCTSWTSGTIDWRLSR